MWNQIKTVLLLGLMSGLVLAIGFFIGGRTGLTFALVLAVLMNFGMFFFSHKLVLAMYRAVPASEKDYSKLHTMLSDLSRKMDLPKPALYIVPTQTPNAFATGPYPSKSVVACTEGILKLLSDEELRGVLAHELSHVKNRDMLVSTVAATMAAVISYIANFAQFAMIFGSDRDNDSGNLLSSLVLIILAPLIALILQLAISRSREFLADASGAKVLRTGVPLASALKKLEAGCHSNPLRHGSPATSSLFIVNPFSAKGLVSLFSTHPSTEARVERLKAMKF